MRVSIPHTSGITFQFFAVSIPSSICQLPEQILKKPVSLNHNFPQFFRRNCGRKPLFPTRLLYPRMQLLSFSFTLPVYWLIIKKTDFRSAAKYRKERIRHAPKTEKTFIGQFSLPHSQKISGSFLPAPLPDSFFPNVCSGFGSPSGPRGNSRHTLRFPFCACREYRAGGFSGTRYLSGGLFLRAVKRGCKGTDHRNILWRGLHRSL